MTSILILCVFGHEHINITELGTVLIGDPLDSVTRVTESKSIWQSFVNIQYIDRLGI